MIKVLVSAEMAMDLERAEYQEKMVYLKLKAFLERRIMGDEMKFWILFY